MDTSAALDTFFLVNDADAVFVHGNRSYRTAPATWANQVCNGVVGTCCRTLAAFPTFLRVNVCPRTANIDCSEMTGLLTGFPHALLAVVCDNVAGNRAVLTCRLYDLYHKVVV